MSLLWWIVVVALILFMVGLVALVVSREYRVWLRATGRGGDIDLTGAKPVPIVGLDERRVGA